MAHVTLMNFPASALIGDNDAQLDAGDIGSPHASFKGRPVLSFDPTAEEAALTPEVSMPGQYAGSTLMATLKCFAAAAGDGAKTIDFEVYVEAYTPGTDTNDLSSATGWDSANEVTGGTVVPTNAGAPFDIDIILTNKDSVAVSDLVRLGLRRDTDDTDDDFADDVHVAALEIWEST